MQVDVLTGREELIVIDEPVRGGLRGRTMDEPPVRAGGLRGWAAIDGFPVRVVQGLICGGGLRDGLI